MLFLLTSSRHLLWSILLGLRGFQATNVFSRQRTSPATYENRRPLITSLALITQQRFKDNESSTPGHLLEIEVATRDDANIGSEKTRHSSFNSVIVHWIRFLGERDWRDESTGPSTQRICFFTAAIAVGLKHLWYENHVFEDNMLQKDPWYKDLDWISRGYLLDSKYSITTSWWLPRRTWLRVCRMLHIPTCRH